MQTNIASSREKILQRSTALFTRNLHFLPFCIIQLHTAHSTVTLQITSIDSLEFDVYGVTYSVLHVRMFCQERLYTLHQNVSD